MKQSLLSTRRHEGHAPSRPGQAREESDYDVNRQIGQRGCFQANDECETSSSCRPDDHHSGLAGECFFGSSCPCPGSPTDGSSLPLGGVAKSWGSGEARSPAKQVTEYELAQPLPTTSCSDKQRDYVADTICQKVVLCYSCVSVTNLLLHSLTEAGERTAGRDRFQHWRGLKMALIARKYNFLWLG